MADKSVNIFEEFGQYYDKMIAWEKRLQNEEPFFREIIINNNVGTVLDVGCGTGQHSIMFSRLGPEVTGVDPSAQMIEEARKNASGSGVKTAFIQKGIGELMAFDQKFDLVTCLGNTLAHMREKKALVNALQEFYDCMTEGGTLVVQMRNYDKVFINKERYMPLNSYRDEDRDILFLRMTDLLAEDLVQFNILVFSRERDAEWSFDTFSETLAPWRKDQLEQSLAEIGFKDIRVYGSYNKAPWVKEKTTDLIITASK